MVKGKKWVLIGDPHQLLPIFRSVKDEKMVESLSSFCYLLKKYKNRVKWLRVHYRSNDKIIGFSAKYIYNGNIRPHEICRKKKLNIDLSGFLSSNKPVVFLNVEGREEYSEGSYINRVEADVAAEIVYMLKKNGVKESDIGVITPYRAQRTRIKNKVGGNVEVNTVDSFQGREKSVIIYSVTGTRERTVEFAGNRNRFNVAVTRAINKLIVLGNKYSILENDILSKFIEYADDIGGYYDLKYVEGEGEADKKVKNVRKGNVVEVYLKNGEYVKGEIIEKTPEFLIVEDDKIVWFIKKNAITRVNI